MEEKTAEVVTVRPPAYILESQPQEEKSKKSCKSKSVYVYALTVSIALIVVIVLASVHYYRSLDVIHSITADSYKKYHEMINSDKSKPPVEQDIEIDTGKKIVVYRMTGNDIPPGTFAVFDYTKSLTGLYDPEKKECYLIAGIQSDIVDPKTLSEQLEKNDTKKEDTVIETLNYRKADDYPVGDKSILPAPLQTPCEYLPTYWLELTDQNNAKNKGVTDEGESGKSRQKRACRYGCWFVLQRRCYGGRCYWSRGVRCGVRCSFG